MSRLTRRVVITGIGVISPLGSDKETYWNNLINGVSGVQRIPYFNVDEYPSQIAGIVKDFKPEDYLDKKILRRLDKYAIMGLAATKMALDDANLKPEDTDPWRVALFVTSGVGGLATFEEEVGKLIKGGPRKVSPLFVPKFIPDILSGWISILYGFKGPSLAHVSACSSSASAIGEAFNTIRLGISDVAIAGGSEAPVTPSGLAGFCAMKALSTRNDEPEKASRPFDATRDGFVLAEGAGVLILEELEHAKRRGAKIYAEIVGYGSTTDGYHITAPHPEGEGIVKAMEIALNDAGIKPEEIDYINAHGTSTPLNDKTETLAIKRVFGEHAYKINISSVKSMMGHTLGASGALETIATALAIKNRIVPPTINYENPDPECDLNYTPNKSQELDIRYAMKNSLGFGGHNVVLILKRYDE